MPRGLRGPASGAGGGRLTTALIDGDIIAYQIASKCQRSGALWGDGAEDSFDEDEVRDGVIRLVDQWTSLARCDDHLVLLTGDRNFRKLVEPTYKLNRKPEKKPIALGFAKSLMIDELGARMVNGLEADDLIGLSITGRYADGRGIAVSMDKDMATLPGLHFNPAKDLAPRTVSLEEADRFWMTQTLTGDTTDGYGGAPRIGPKKAAKVLEGLKTLDQMWPAVVAAYASVKKRLNDAVTTSRLARILRRGDYDPINKEIRLWHPSTPSTMPLSAVLASSLPPIPASATSSPSTAA